MSRQAGEYLLQRYLPCLAIFWFWGDPHVAVLTRYPWTTRGDQTPGSWVITPPAFKLNPAKTCALYLCYLCFLPLPSCSKIFCYTVWSTSVRPLMFTNMPLHSLKLFHFCYLLRYPVLLIFQADDMKTLALYIALFQLPKHHLLGRSIWMQHGNSILDVFIILSLLWKCPTFFHSFWFSSGPFSKYPKIL